MRACCARSWALTLALGDLHALLLDLVSLAERRGTYRGLIHLDLRQQPFLVQVAVHSLLQFRILVVSFDGCCSSALVQTFGREPRLETVVVCLSCAELLFGLAQRLLKRRLRHFKHDGVGLDDGAGAQDDALDASLRDGRDDFAAPRRPARACRGRAR